jgi:MYXO-CTERM domain-containing protein
MKLTSLKCAVLVAAAFAAASPAAASMRGNDTQDSGYDTRAQDDDDFPWGLLGLLGLAGLAGLKRRERDIHVDARRDR